MARRPSRSGPLRVALTGAGMISRHHQASFDNTIAHFVDCIDSGAAFETDAIDNIETLKLVDQAYRAAAR